MAELGFDAKETSQSPSPPQQRRSRSSSSQFTRERTGSRSPSPSPSHSSFSLSRSRARLSSPCHWSSSSSQSPDSVLRPSFGGKKQESSATLCIFFKHFHGKNAHSLCAIDLPNSSPENNGLLDDPPLMNLENFPFLTFIVEFPRQDSGMRCAKLGSHLYFLGGKYVKEDILEDGTTYQFNYPPDVYVIAISDISYAIKSGTALSSITPTSTMKSGKHSLVAFVANEKLYILGA
ncbi:hypothetical protein O6P43_026774 [Quillaja saponaria]|uniref:Uncharacterized protein n=1 Tax=Quillaja saponaria TaxID=32244 RepID=A0AAD7L361_QUISA|nr:hypothetical protein O6P43_026774 [Quillaja saponaria]